MRLDELKGILRTICGNDGQHWSMVVTCDRAQSRKDVEVDCGVSRRTSRYTMSSRDVDRI